MVGVCVLVVTVEVAVVVCWLFGWWLEAVFVLVGGCIGDVVVVMR